MCEAAIRTPLLSRRPELVRHIFHDRVDMGVVEVFQVVDGLDLQLVIKHDCCVVTQIQLVLRQVGIAGNTDDDEVLFRELILLREHAGQFLLQTCCKILTSVVGFVGLTEDVRKLFVVKEYDGSCKTSTVLVSLRDALQLLEQRFQLVANRKISGEDEHHRVFGMFRDGAMIAALELAVDVIGVERPRQVRIDAKGGLLLFVFLLDFVDGRIGGKQGERHQQRENGRAAHWRSLRWTLDVRRWAISSMAIRESVVNRGVGERDEFLPGRRSHVAENRLHKTYAIVRLWQPPARMAMPRLETPGDFSGSQTAAPRTAMLMTSLKNTIKAALCGLYKYSGVARVQEAIERRAGREFLAILIFHRVTDAIPQDPLTISTARFERVCCMLRNGFRVVGLSEVFDLIRSGAPLPPRTVAITFDDSYRDNLYAARVLQRYGLPATFFVPTAYVGTDHVFDWDRHLPRLPNLTWNDVREMAGMGFEIGSHTVSHANLAKVSFNDAQYEIIESKKALEQRLDKPVRWLAYPYGGLKDMRPELLSYVEEAGYDGCLSAFGGFVYPGCDPRVLPRTPVPAFHSVLNLELHLTGCLNWMYALKRRMGWIHGPENPIPDGEFGLSLKAGREVCREI
jgi:peptidoglycan/xylan/chitin deacetylase (PgdA/CDA1 family)